MHRQWQSGVPRSRRAERGAVAVIVALTLAVLIGVVGLALDLGKMYVVKSELQNSMDACALAASRDLTGALPLSVATGSGTAAASLNNVFFQKFPVSSQSSGVTVSVTFSDSPNDAFDDPATAAATYGLSKVSYVKCTAQMSGIANWFIQVLGIAPVSASVGQSQTVAAQAMATVAPAQSACALPVYVCQPSNNTYILGQWFASKFGSSLTGQLGGGNFGWANYGNNNSASTVGSLLTGAGQCNLTGNTPIGTTGNQTANAKAWNTRFGIYSPNFGGPSGGTPDFTGYAYSINQHLTGDLDGSVYADFLSKRSSYTPYQGDTPLNGFSTGGNTTINPSWYRSGADRRIAIVPAVDCAGFLVNGTHQVPVQKWLCVLMVDPMDVTGNGGAVHLEYRGDASNPASPCATEGIPGGTPTGGPKVPVLVQ